MSDLLEMLIRWFSKPVTLRRFIGFAIAIFITIALLFFYERYTFSFRLGRLQKEAELLSRVQELEPQRTNQVAALEQARKSLQQQIAETIEQKPVGLEFVPATLTVSMNSLWKFLAGSAVWFVTTLFPLRKWKTKAKAKELPGIISAGFIVGLLAIMVPAVWWPWFHLFIYPILFSLLLLLAISPIAIFLALKAAKKRAEEISCTNNLKQIGLAARIWAGKNGECLPKHLSALKTIVGDRRVLCCPSDENKPYEILSPDISTSNPSIVYMRCPTHNLLVLADGSVQRLGMNQLVQENGVWVMKAQSPAG